MSVPPEYRLVTVNTSPERAQRVIGSLVEALKNRYTIIHAANVERIEDVKETVERERPDVLFTASMWTPEQAKDIVNIAKSVNPGLKTFSVPQGLHASGGPAAILEHIKENLPDLLDA
ncbi:hypothetical protein K438DRAFT_1834459 [Mycena galopus ATCC 62051]|nr:hypothetical protein K438DRAFT_1834459 [Mycena galopus ATCC 62051]